MMCIDAVKARLGSISKTKMETMPNGVKTLLAKDLPYILRELTAARELAAAANIRHLRDLPDGSRELCECCICKGISKARKKYDEARKVT